ncbi:MAG: HNH endonuclease [Bdellovibrionales bacterium]
MFQPHMTDYEVESNLEQAVRKEHRIAKDILLLIRMAEDRKIFAKRGFSSMFAYLTKHHKYSEGAANRRIHAARLLTQVPQAQEKLESGELNLSTLNQAQRIFTAQEKASDQKLTTEQKAEALSKIESQSTTQVEQTLLALFPAAASHVSQERISTLSEDTSRLNTTLSNEVRERFEKVRDLLSHILPNAKFIDVADYLMKRFLEEHERQMQKAVAREARMRDAPVQENRTKTPKKKTRVQNKESADTKATSRSTPASEATETTAAPTKQRSNKSRVSASVRRVVIQRAGGRCEYQDPVAGRRCESSHQLEADQIVPRALEGGNELSNLRCLCGVHNRMMAEIELGKAWAEKWRNHGPT